MRIVSLAMLFPVVFYAQDTNDCEGAIVICDNGPVSYAPNGPGNFDFATGICPTTEHQSAWYYIAFSDTMPPNQILEFTLTPNAGDDYDFAMWGPDVPCDMLDDAGMVRCNFSPIGITGLQVGGTGAFEEALTVNPGEGYYLMVDNFSNNTNGFSIDWMGSAAPYLDCNANPNCDLEADAGTNIVACIGQDFTLTGSSVGGDGNEVYNWKVSPENVIIFITDTSSAITTVNIPDGFGQEFEFLLTVSNDSCIALSSVVVTLTLAGEPEFSLDTTLCQTDGVLVLPTTSDDGIVGSWNPTSIDPTTTIGTIDAIFTPDPSQGDCVDTTSITFEIFQSIDPDFTILTELCESDDIYVLPTTSDNGVNGTWSPSSIDPAGNAGMTFTLNFTPTDPGCFSDVQRSITVIAGIEPDFDLENTICETADALVLSPISMDGFTGQWTIPIIDPSGQAGLTITSVFIPDPDQGTCLIDYMHQWTVEVLVTPQFDPFPSLCADDVPFIFPTSSSDGVYVGTWNPSQIDPSAVSPDVYETVFTPDAIHGDCVDDVTMTIEILELTTVEFNPLTLCELEDPYVLSPTSNNGIVGTWTPTSINPDGLGGNVVSAQFIPTLALCTEPFILDITIEDAQEAVFDLPNSMCESDDPIALPAVSDNGIVGEWSTPILDPFNLGGSFIITEFIPNAILHPCAESYEITVLVDEAITPEFNIPDEVCENADLIILETNSLNGILGVWSIPVINPTGLGGTTIQTVFTPATTDCAENYIHEITVVSEPVITDVRPTNPSDCGVNDGVIEIESPNLSIEYSIDGGITWQASGVFGGLGGGNYNILIRNSNLSECFAIAQAILETPGAPTISIIDEIHISDCELTDGNLVIHAHGNSALEYSIDNGVTWQRDSTFSDLDGQTYQILVREINSPSCVTNATATISEPEQITIDSIYLFDVTDCETNNGRISIAANGIDLEYSINGGLSWRSTSIFDSLYSGRYEVVVRNSIFRNCIDVQSVLIQEPDPVFISNVVTSNLTDCQSEDGSIAISAMNGPLEYSLDDGITWQRDSVFTNLSPGNYSILVRRITAHNCEAGDIAMITAPNAPVLDSISITPLTDCGMNDAQLVVWAHGLNLEYSLDNGITWQGSEVFTDLMANTYEVIVRSADFINCTVSQTVRIDALQSISIIDVDIEDVTQCDEANGSLEVNANGSDLEYSLDGMNWQSSDRFENLAAGIYLVQIRHINYPSCRDETMVELRAPNAPEITNMVVQEISDCGLRDGSIEIISTSINVEYSIDNGVSWQSEANFENLGPGVYSIIIRDQVFVSCRDNAEVILIDPECACGGVEFIAMAKDLTCFADNSGEIEIFATDDQVDFAIEWQTGQSNATLDDLHAGTYVYTVSYRDNCTISDTVIVAEPPPMTALIVASTVPCPMSTMGMITVVNVEGGNGNYEYGLNGQEFQLLPTFNHLSSGAYSVEIIDELGCSLVLGADITSDSDPEIQIVGNNQVTVGEEIELFAEFDPSLIDSFAWIDDIGNIISTENPLTFIAENEFEIYFVSYYADCEKLIPQTILVKEIDVFFPNAFSPNNDGINDLYIPLLQSSISDVTIDLRIYNRWGGKVYERIGIDFRNPTFGWNGYLNNKKQGEGIYLYQSTVYFPSGAKEFAGEIYLIR